MATTELIGTASTTTPATSSTMGSSDLDKDDFLLLLVTQLQNQDPLNPSDSTEFTAQLAQFSALEQLTNVNDNLKYLQLYQASINNAQAVDFIGKTVIASGDTISVSDGVSDDIIFDLSGDAENTTISIYDGSGQLVATLDGGALSDGEQSISWDGKNEDGDTVSDGVYTFEVSAVDSNGNSVIASTYSEVVITGVTFEDGTTYLLAGDKKIPMGDVITIKGSAATDS